MIPFPGTAECMNALMRGDVPLAIASNDSIRGLVQAQEAKLLLTFSETREYPDAVTLKEIGYPELIDKICSHRFIVAPPGLEQEPETMLLAAIKRATTDKDFVAWAKNAEFPLTNLYGTDAERFFLKFMRYYEDMAPAFKEHLS